MTLDLIFFFLLSLIAVATAIGMLLSRNAIYSALFLVLNFITVAVFYLLLGAPFIAMAQITVDPGGSSGWHSHPGGAIIVVQTGTLTVYRSLGSQCQTTTYSAGQAFIERPGEVDNVVNTGTVPYVVYVTFPRVPQGESARTDEPDPGTCPGL